MDIKKMTDLQLALMLDFLRGYPIHTLRLKEICQYHDKVSEVRNEIARRAKKP